MSERQIRVVDLFEVESNRRRGGDIRTMLSPKTVGSTSGFLGVTIIAPGDYVAEHYHPYSEEFLFAVCGNLTVDLDDLAHELGPDQGLMVPQGVRHRVRNTGPTEARIVFHLSPLAPRPDLGHVDTEAHAAVTAARSL